MGDGVGVGVGLEVGEADCEADCEAAGPGLPAAVGEPEPLEQAARQIAAAAIAVNEAACQRCALMRTAP